jgi:hypothetical protein
MRFEGMNLCPRVEQHLLDLQHRALQPSKLGTRWRRNQQMDYFLKLTLLATLDRRDFGKKRNYATEVIGNIRQQA